MAPGVQRVRQDRLNDDVLIQGIMYVLLLPPDKAVIALDGHVAEPSVALATLLWSLHISARNHSTS